MDEHTIQVGNSDRRRDCQIRIAVVAGPHRGMAWTFADSQTIVVGRQSPAHLRLFDEPAISRRHLELRLDPPRAELADLGSSNGTLVNGIRVLSASLGHEDRIQIGQTELMFEVIGQSEFGTAASSTNKAIADRRDDETIDVAIGSPPGPTFNQSAASNKEVCATPGFAAAALMASATDMSDHTMLASQVPIEVGSYRLERLIGQGGMSTVHLATHKQTGEVFAVKLIHRDLANDGKPRRMFMREAALLTQLDHPRIVRAIEFGLQDDVPYLVMQYIDSLDLTQLLDTKPLAERIKIATWATFTILQAVHYLHDEGIVHRDIKPSNVLAYREGRHLKIKLADFGLAKCFDDSDHHNMTNERSLRGTLSFMAPEQMANSRDAGPLVDLFACGACLYRWITGELANMILKPAESLERLRGSESVPVELKAVIERGIAIDPADRFQTAEEFGKRLFPFHQKR